MSLSNSRWTVIFDGPGVRTLRICGVPLDSTLWASEAVDARAFTRAALLAVDVNLGVAWGSGVVTLEGAIHEAAGAAGLWAGKFGVAGQTKRIAGGAATELGATAAATLTAFGLLTGVDITEDAALRARVTTACTNEARGDLLLTLVNPLRLE